MAGTTPVSALPYAQLTDSPNINTASQGIATALDHLVVPKYATVGARNTANPSPTAGDLCYVTALGVHESYNGSGWVYLYPKTTVLGSTFTVTNSSTLADVTGWTGIALEAGSTYTLSGCMFLSSTSTAASIKVNLQSDVGDTTCNLNYFGGIGSGGAATTNASPVYVGFSGFTSSNLQVTMDSAANDTITLNGTVTAVTACQLKWQTANGTAGAGRTTGFLAGSYFQLKKIS